jgi:hypothetical protein
MRNQVEELLEQLREDHPLWTFWVIYRAIGGVTWCARPKGLEKPVFNADSVGELEKKLADLA